MRAPKNEAVKSALRVLVTGVLWAVIWGTSAYVAVLTSAFFNPDFGHVGPGLTAMIMSVVAALSGAVAGVIFAVLIWLASPIKRSGRVLVGLVLGATLGIVLAAVSRPHYFRIAVIPAALGAFSGLCSIPPRKPQQV